MAKFTWEGKARDGKYVKGTISADSEQIAFKDLNQKGITVTRLKEKPPFNIKDLTNLQINIGGIPARDLMIFTRQFSTMLDSGLPLVQAIDILANTSENKYFGMKCALSKLGRNSAVLLQLGESRQILSFIICFGNSFIKFKR